MNEPRNSQMRYDIDERPPVGESIILAIQHVFAMFGATILVPILVNQMAGAEVIPIPVAICTSGIGTLIYQRCTKKQSPVYLGSSFAFISPIALAYQAGGIAGAMTGVLLVGAIYMIVAFVISRVGNNWVNELLPPVVIGPMILIIGLGLSSSAISQIGLNADAELDWRNLVAAGITLATAIIFMVFVKGFFNIIPFLMAIVVGYIVSIPLGLVDFTPVREAAWFSIPHFAIIGLHYRPDFVTAIQMAPVALVTMPEHIGDHKTLSTITGRDLLENPGLARTLLGDGLASCVAALVGGPSNTTYGENTGVVGMTGVASVFVIKLAAIFAIIMSGLGKLTALISTIPSPVLGGVSVLLYGFIGLNGAKVWIKHRLDLGFARNIIIASVMLVFGLGGAVISRSIGNVTIALSGMSLAAILGVFLNWALPVSDDEAMQQFEQQRDEARLKVLRANPELLQQVDQLLKLETSE